MLDQPLFAAVKARLADVPGIDGMSVSNIAGRMQFGMDGKIAAVDENATDADIDAAIRATFGSNALKTLTAPLTSATLPVVALAPAAAPSTAVVPAKETAAVSVTGASHVGTSLKDMLTQRKAKISAAHDKLSANFDKLDVATAALDTLGDKVGSEADDLLSVVGQFTNDLG